MLRRAFLRIALCAMTLTLVLIFSGMVKTGATTGLALAASAYSPRHSGLEPPGGPKPLEALPGRSMGRTAEGGMGYTDAYGNTVDDRPPPEKEARRRPHPGAYGQSPSRDSRPLPDPQPQGSTPAWTFK